MTHLLATLSAHGLGHLAQSAPVLNALRRRLPALRLTVASTLPEPRLRARIEGDFRIDARPLDVGFVMEDAFRVAHEASADAYREFHADWPERVARTTAWLAREQPDLLLCNAAYLPLAAAGRLGMPAFGMSSLNWADLFAHVFAGQTWAAPVHAQMIDAYRQATAFIKLTPGMDMPGLDRGLWAGPVAAIGTPRRAELRERLAARRDERIVLVAFGGIDTRLPLQRWPMAEGLRWLVPGAWRFEHAQVAAIESLGWGFTDLVASVDAVVGKPGYGTFVEAACHGTPLLYARRPQWPEQDALIRWLHAHGRAREIGDRALRDGHLAGELDALWRQPPTAAVVPTGAEEVAALLSRYIPPMAER
jgi:hypothetical protein